jgi:hypothetical protein
MFPTISFLACKNIRHNRISNTIFSIISILVNLRTCCLQTTNLEEVIFMCKIDLVIQELTSNHFLIW